MKQLTKIILFPLINFAILSVVSAEIGYLQFKENNKSHRAQQVVETWAADHEYLGSILAQAPNVSQRIPSNTILEIPFYDGFKHAFKFFETSVMHHSLAQRYPEIKSYMGVGLDNPSDRASIVVHRRWNLWSYY